MLEYVNLINFLNPNYPQILTGIIPVRRNTSQWLMSNTHTWWPYERASLISGREAWGAALWKIAFAKAMLTLPMAVPSEQSDTAGRPRQGISWETWDFVVLASFPQNNTGSKTLPPNLLCFSPSFGQNETFIKVWQFHQPLLIQSSFSWRSTSL